MKKLGKLNLMKEKMLSHEELVSFRGVDLEEAAQIVSIMYFGLDVTYITVTALIHQKVFPKKCVVQKN